MNLEDLIATLDRYEAEAGVQPRPKRGAPIKPRTIARERLAAELGVSAETLRKREWDASKGGRPKAPPKFTGIRSLGLTLSEEFVSQVTKAQEYIDAADRALRQAQASLTKMAGDVGVVFPAGRLQRLQEDTRELAGKVRGARPVSLCPWCKGLDGQAECSACVGTGFITASQDNAVPRELLDVQVVRVMVRGELVEPQTDAWGLGE